MFTGCRTVVSQVRLQCRKVLNPAVIKRECLYMKIKRGLPTKRSRIYGEQVMFMAKVIRRLEAACHRKFGEKTDLTYEEFLDFRDMDEYSAFSEAAFVCGFVCEDFGLSFPLEEIHSSPEEMVSRMPFSKIRHYIHVLQRAEKWQSDYSTTLWTAVMSGALRLVADRLISDTSLYEAERI